MEFKGTKGKWQIDDNLIFADDYFQTHIAVLPSESYDDVTTKANALLISKAPEMLQELIKEVEILKAMGLGDTERCKRKEQLIKEATELKSLYLYKN